MTAFYDTQPLHTLYISVVSIAEIRFGIELQEDPSRRAQLNDWLTLTLRPAFAGKILPLTEDILLKWPPLMEHGRKIGHTYSHPDLLLAANVSTGLQLSHATAAISIWHGCRSSIRGRPHSRRVFQNGSFVQRHGPLWLCVATCCGLISGMNSQLLEKIIVIAFDKALIGGLLGLAAFLFTRSLEKFKSSLSHELERFKADQNRRLAEFTLEENRKTETYRNELNSEKESRSNIRLAVAELSKRIAAAAHALCWTTWYARYAPDSFTADDIVKYEADMRLLLSDVVSARVVVAALSPTVHDQLSPLIAKLYKLDVKTSEAKTTLSKQRDQGLEIIGTVFPEASNLEAELLSVVTKLTI